MGEEAPSSSHDTSALAVQVAIVRERVDSLRENMSRSMTEMQTTFSTRLDHMEHRVNVELKEGRAELLGNVREQIGELKAVLADQQKEGGQTKASVQRILIYVSAIGAIAAFLAAVVAFAFKVADVYFRLPTK